MIETHLAKSEFPSDTPFDDNAALQWAVESFRRNSCSLRDGGTAKQISFDASNREHVNQVIDFAMNFPFLQNEPFPVTREALLQSFMSVDELGYQIKKQTGDSAFLNLRAKRGSR